MDTQQNKKPQKNTLYLLWMYGGKNPKLAEEITTAAQICTKKIAPPTHVYLNPDDLNDHRFNIPGLQISVSRSVQRRHLMIGAE